MFKHTLLGLAAGGALAFAALTGSIGAAQAAGTSIDIGIAVPGLQLIHSSRPRDCWLPEKYLCGGPVYGRPHYGRPYYGRPIYGRPVYGWPGYYGGYRTPPIYYGRSRHW